MNNFYEVHLHQLNTSNDNSNDELLDNANNVNNSGSANNVNNSGSADDANSTNSMFKKCAICPITKVKLDASDLAMTISVIRDVREAYEHEHEILALLGYPTPVEENKFEIHIADVFEINAAKRWFCDRHGYHPISRKNINPIVKSRIEFRFKYQDQLKVIPPKEVINDAFNKYLHSIVNGKFDLTSDYIILLRCHLRPEDMPNFLYVNREQAQDIIFEAKNNSVIKLPVKLPVKRPGLSWIIRPSNFKGYKFALDHDGHFYPMTEYVAITYIDGITGEFRNQLFEKVFSCGYYDCSGAYINESLDYKQGRGYPCFFDILHDTLPRLFNKYKCDILNVNYNNESVNYNNVNENENENENVSTNTNTPWTVDIPEQKMGYITDII